MLLLGTMAACGDSDDGDAQASAPKAPATIPELTKDPLTLSFIWFEWPPAQALEKFANEEYKKERPNTTVKVDTVPNANWHDAMFTQFAARKTDFDIAILDSQHIGEAVTNANILDLTDFVKGNIDVNAYDPYLLAAYGQFPQAETGQRDENASLYGLPLLGDTWTMIYRKDLIGDQAPQTWDEMISAAQKCQTDNPGVSGLAFHQANGSDAAAVTYNTVNGVYGGNLWESADKQIEGVINDDAGQKAMDVLVNEKIPGIKVEQEALFIFLVDQRKPTGPMAGVRVQDGKVDLIFINNRFAYKTRGLFRNVLNSESPEDIRKLLGQEDYGDENVMGAVLAYDKQGFVINYLGKDVNIEFSPVH